MAKEVITIPNAPKLLFSPAMKAGDYIFCAGYGPRAIKGFGLNYATSNIGAAICTVITRRKSPTNPTQKQWTP